MTKKGIEDLKVSIDGKQEMEKVEVQFNMFEKQLKSISEGPSKLIEQEQQTQLSNREINSADAPYIKPSRTIGSREPFNEKYRAEYDYAKQYVRCIAENNEIKGEVIELWAKPYPGVNCEFWKVPVNKPIHLPRYVASQINTRIYYQYAMEDKPSYIGSEGGHQFMSGISAKHTKHRLDCRPSGNTMISMFS